MQIIIKSAFVVLGAVLITGFSACKIVTSLVELRRKKPQVYTYHWQDKAIAYLPMHHLGKPRFYEGVKEQVVDHKRRGYTVYYELISSRPAGLDSLERLQTLLKYRKLRGSSGSYKEQTEELGVFKNYVQQPPYEQLGTDETDKRADVDIVQFVAEWERTNGPVVLDSLDRATPMTAKYESATMYSRKEYARIIEDYRTAYLVGEVKSSPANKILILYGKGHLKGFRRGLRKN